MNERNENGDIWQPYPRTNILPQNITKYLLYSNYIMSLAGLEILRNRMYQSFFFYLPALRVVAFHGTGHGFELRLGKNIFIT